MRPSDKLITKVGDTIERYRMATPGDKIVVAVSGGPDSVCLLDVLYRLRDALGIGLAVAHLEHGFREGEDEAETAFVEALAKGYGIPYEHGRARGLHRDIPSLEERARVERYRFLEKTRAKFAAQKIALGHQMDDQAETVLLHCLRGSGPSGLSGIPPCRGGIFIRPLIRVRRGEIDLYLKDRSLFHMRDPSNLDLRRTRNWVRHDLIPRIKAHNPRLVETLCRSAEILAEDDDYLQREAKTRLQEMAPAQGESQMVLPLDPLLNLHKAVSSRVIRQVIQELRGDLRKIRHSHVEAVLECMRGTRPQSKLDLPDGIVVERVYGKVVFRIRKEASVGDYAYTLDRPGSYRLEIPGCTLALEEMDAGGLPDLKTPGNTAFIDAETLSYPLIVRNFRPGDRFIPLGMRGRKKVKEFFGDLKVPFSIRRLVPILISGDHPIWICGYRIDDRVKVTHKTRRVLKATLSGLAG